VPTIYCFRIEILAVFRQTEYRAAGHNSLNRVCLFDISGLHAES